MKSRIGRRRIGADGRGGVAVATELEPDAASCFAIDHGADPRRLDGPVERVPGIAAGRDGNAFQIAPPTVARAVDLEGHGYRAIGRERQMDRPAGEA